MIEIKVTVERHGRCSSLMRVIKENVSVALILGVRPRIRNILPRYESYQSSCRMRYRVATRTSSSSSFPSLYFFFFFTFAFRRPRPVPSLPLSLLLLLLLLGLALSLSFSLSHFLTLSFSRDSPSYYVLADTCHYYSQDRMGRRADVCKCARETQWALSRVNLN